MILQYIVICAAAFVTSGLTLLSGFGLGTILLPAFVVFFPVDVAIAMTAIVHFLNNLFKLTLLGKYAVKSIVITFGLPAILGAFLGAWLLTGIADVPAMVQYEILGHELSITPVKLMVGMLMLLFALMEVLPRARHLSFPKKYLPVGGVLSGLFGGISGHQGALRSAFLVRSGLSTQQYLGTSVLIACMVDISRLSIYTARFSSPELRSNWTLLGAAVLSAFAGAITANRLVPKITLKSIQLLVSVLLLMIAVSLMTGFL